MGKWNNGMKWLAVTMALTVLAPSAAMAVDHTATQSGQQVSTAAAQSVAAAQMMPLRQPAELVGAEVQWDAATSSIVIKSMGHTSQVVLGVATATVDGKEVPLSAPAELRDGLTWVPQDFLTAALGFKVAWNAEQGVSLEQSDLTAKAAVLAGTFRTGSVAAGLTGSYSQNLNKAITAEGTIQYFMQQAMPLGAFKGFTKAEQSNDGVFTNVALGVAFEHGAVTLISRFDKEGKIDDFLVEIGGMKTPELYKTPAYVDQAKFTEKQVVVGEGTEWATPGTLTVPNTAGPHPVLVLVHGSGANDRDETMMGLKPFRDLAEGLASKGIAVLRYDKRSYMHGVKSSGLPNATVKEEQIDDAMAAVALAAKTEGIDPKQIYVLGHSQGGYVMPRILEADQDKQIAGAVIMSGPVGWTEVLSRQFKYLYEQKALPQQTYDFMKGQFDLVLDPAFDPKNPPKEFMLGHWWLDMEQNKPAEIAKNQSGKLLIVQGKRDYQVFADQLQGWKDALANRTDVTYKMYDKLNHFYTEGEGELSTPMEYATPNNVPEYVVNDIAAWVQGK